MKKKHELLKYAYDNYPKGAVVRPVSNTGQQVCQQNFRLDPHGHVWGDVEYRDKIIAVMFYNKHTEVWAETPVFVMTSEDGLPLYDGDTYYCATKEREWFLIKNNKEFTCIIKPTSAAVDMVDTHKAFSTKEAAEAWIKENNKPKEIYLFQDTDHPTKVTKDGFGSETSKSRYDVSLTGEQLEQVYEAYKSLQ